MLRRGLEVGGLGRGVSAGGVRGRGHLLALGVHRQGNDQSRNFQSGKEQRERRKTPGGDHDSPQDRGGGGTRLFYAAVRSGPRCARRSDGRGRRFVRRLGCTDRFIPFQVNSAPPALPGDSPGNVAAPVRRFHLQAGAARNRKKERASGVSYQALNAQPDRISRDRHIPLFHSARSSRS